MPKITLTDFVDVVTRSGTTKITKIAQIKNRPHDEIDAAPRQMFLQAVERRP
jgi:hypothetical protein